MKKYYVPTGYYWMDEVEVNQECDMNLIEAIALACIEQGKGRLVECVELSSEEFDEYDSDEEWTYVDLKSWGHDLYFINTYGIREVE